MEIITAVATIGTIFQGISSKKPKVQPAEAPKEPDVTGIRNNLRQTGGLAGNIFTSPTGLQGQNPLGLKQKLGE